MKSDALPGKARRPLHIIVTRACNSTVGAGTRQMVHRCCSGLQGLLTSPPSYRRTNTSAIVGALLFRTQDLRLGHVVSRTKQRIRPPGQSQATLDIIDRKSRTGSNRCASAALGSTVASKSNPRQLQWTHGPVPLAGSVCAFRNFCLPDLRSKRLRARRGDDDNNRPCAAGHPHTARLRLRRL